MDGDVSRKSSLMNRLKTTAFKRPAVALIVCTLAACASPGESNAPTSSASSAAPAASATADEHAQTCDLPEEIAQPEWLPPDLPLPEGTYAFEDRGPDSGYYNASFILPMSTDEFGEFVRSEWPAAEYQLGRGDQEPWEVEATFAKPPGIGQFKANLLQCTPARSRLALRWGPERYPTPTP
jgi:hypothetical protein